MSTAKRDFQLKPSRLALLFQLSLLILFSVLSFQLLHPLLWLLGLLLAAVSYYGFQRRSQLTALAHLDGAEWSLQFNSGSKIQRGLLEHILDHQLYLVLYFHHAPVKSAVIWRDQVSFAEWKALKKLAKTI
ncbi:hypothetical protein [Acinetobacter indicus]|uniref:hypothetical protein n=1 Tax=Acinetobacter indicus TaxID=756892 RepID=UPI00143FDD84|nr:hypothetical protein [Acinetobacter indicus]MDM1290751.1 hypothetical protein [Acinetobacter indicus]MDM1320886.1 hypothetical protein [Acinetobacter indicus]MDM1332607.1 hypothetical protein [Acinetobacter indicus]QIZ59435.1 hypothetical protein FK537_10040 [Acinetobacter indicus]QSG84192.1 hypothetical protein JYB86_13010 [Acinetobacter indicus]